MLSNLINNAIKFTSVGGKVVVRCEASSDGSTLEMSVSDTGHGINQSHLERIFEPFYTTRTVGKGTGLGLSVVHGIVASHKGEISVESELGKGTTFYVCLSAIEH